MTFDIPNVTTLKNKCLSTVAENFRGFKSKLTSRYIFGSQKNKSQCKTYKAIDEETWRLFVQSQISEEWKLWMMYMFGVSNNLGYNDVYGFIDPHVIHETNDFDEITTYLTRRFASEKNILLFLIYLASMMLVGRAIANNRKLEWIALKV
ncbi:hypothetical protein LR48_Vigan03g072800 [Vigna angularis]|uniref:Uncharacterized protein n=1 Tax=Phaseolus angularis TaxID=3914 RepID=A0A0L9U3T1_PHAAN|nr:hypothetical protein LR48_Vigan03g072800 [Vigna angularis]